MADAFRHKRTPGSDASGAKRIPGGDTLNEQTSRPFNALELSSANRQILSSDFGGATVLDPGMAWGGWPASPVSTGASEGATRAQTMILFNHRAALLALSEWTGLYYESWLNEDGRPSVIVTRGDATENPPYANWNGNTVQWADQDEEELSFWLFLALPPSELAPPTQSAEEASDQLAIWTSALTTIAERLPSGDLQAAVDLEYVFNHREEVRSLACVALTRAYIDADNAINAGSATIDDFTREIANQHLLLAMEYVDVLGFYLQRPAIDWLRSETVDLSTSFAGPDTTGRFLYFFSDLLEEALYWADPEAYR